MTVGILMLHCCINIDIIVFSLNSVRTTLIFSKKLLRTTNYHHTKSCLVPIYIFCINIIWSFPMTKFKTYLLNLNIIFLHLNLILMLRKYWHHCFLAEFTRTTLIFSKKLLCTTNYHHTKSCLVQNGRVQCKFLCLYVVVSIANEDKKLQTPADIIPLYARKI
jgi:hypothetical protein